MLLYLYSWEPPIYYELTKAVRSVDESKVDTLGPFAVAMQQLFCKAVFGAEQKRKDALKSSRTDRKGPYGFFS